MTGHHFDQAVSRSARSGDPSGYAELTAEFEQSAQRWAQSRSPLARLRKFREQTPGFERDAWVEMAQSGWMGILIPEQLGGLGLDIECAGAIARAIGEHPIPEPYVAGAIQVVAALLKLPASDARDHLLSAIAQGEKIVGLAWKEGVRGQTGAGALTLNGETNWVMPGAGADGWVVKVLVDSQPALVWVPAKTKGLDVVRQGRTDGTEMAKLIFDSVSVPASDVLIEGAEVDQVIEDANDVARLAQACELLGIAMAAHKMTLEYLNTRIQFGKPIGANQALQHRMVDASLQVELASSCLKEVFRGLVGSGMSLSLAASRAKARCAHAALTMTQLSIQFHGAIGFTDEYDLGLYFKRVLNLVSWLGGAREHRQRAMSLSSFGQAETVQTETVGSTATATVPIDLDTLPENAFRAAIRAFLHAHYPAALRHPPRRLRWSEIKPWYLALSKQGWLAPAWPKEYGGMGLSPDKLLMFFEEFEHFGAARMPDQGIINLGPILIQNGTPEQKQYYLPKILSGEHIWCQGYSEPNAGSDLASLRTQAVLEGDEFVVNGQKIWTTLAHDATHVFLLVRTDNTVKKQAGISFLLVDIGSPGVTVRPIRNIAGEEEFCEVFFENVRVPAKNLVGELNQGWSIAKSLLGFERLFVGSPQQSRHALGQLEKLATVRGLFNDPVFNDMFATLWLDVEDLGAMYGYFADFVRRGEALPDSVSLLKIWATETYARISLQIAQWAEESGGSRDPYTLLGGETMDPLSALFNATITTIYGGTNEIQRNIYSKQVLRLPA